MVCPRGGDGRGVVHGRVSSCLRGGRGVLKRCVVVQPYWNARRSDLPGGGSACQQGEAVMG